MAALACLCGLLAAASPRAAELLVLLGVTVAVGVVMRHLPPWQLALILGAAIGFGNIVDAVIGSGANVILLLLAVLNIPPLSRASRIGRWLLIVAGALLISSTVATSTSARVSLAVVLGLGSTIAAATWAVTSVASIHSRRLQPLLVVEAAGVVAALGVLTGELLGHPLVAMTANEIRDAVVAGGIQRGSGSFAAPNAAALVVSAGALAATVVLSQGKGSLPALRWHVSTLALCILALILTGSRTSLAAFSLAAAILTLGVLRRRGGLGAWLVIAAAAAVWFAARLGTFKGRSLDLLSATDPSSIYRHQVQTYLLHYLPWSQLRGFGFTSGVTLAPNVITTPQNIGNVDEAWMYAVLALGILSLAGFAVIIVLTTLRNWSVNKAVAVAALVWIGICSLSENIFLLPGPMTAATFLLAGAWASGVMPARRVDTLVAPSAKPRHGEDARG